MKEILFLELKISLALAIFYMVYRLMLGNDTFFVRNRFYLLGAMLASFIVPWLKFETKVYNNLPAITYFPSNASIPATTIQGKESNLWPIVMEVALAVYLLGVIFYLVRFVWAYNKVFRLIVKSEKKKIRDLILVITRLSVAPFSLLKWLVVPAHHLQHPDFENIVQHESIHSRQYHSVDLFLAELMVAFQWFNPFAWYLKKSMVENHEFIVDREIVQNGMDSRKYQYLLLNLTTGRFQPTSVNYFNTNLIKKRIRMMNKTKSPVWHGLKNGIILISMTLVVAITATFETKVIAQNANTDPLYIVNGKRINYNIKNLNPDKILSIEVFKDSSAISKYGKDGEHGVIEITLKDTINYLLSGPNSLEGVEIRKVREISPNDNDVQQVQMLTDKNENSLLITSYSEESVDNTMRIRNRDTSIKTYPLFVLEGEIITKEEFERTVKPDDISLINVLKDKSATDKYGNKGKDGVLEITLKKQTTNNIEDNLIIVPNPASDNVQVTIKGSSTIDRLGVKIYDNSGDVVYQDKKTGPSFSLSVSALKTGSYIISVSDGKNVNRGNLVVSH